MPKKLEDCVADVKAKGVKPIPGRTEEESAYAICQASISHKSFDPRTGVTSELIKAMQTSHWPDLGKSVRGGLDHVLSIEVPRVSTNVSKAEEETPITTAKTNPRISHLTAPDSGAYYAELWSRGGNWYAATPDAINEIDGVSKGMSLSEVVPRFLSAITKASCVPCNAARR